jgi:plasmid maintenance system killer protein
MKTKVLTCALVLASLAISAQTEKKEATVRIKKVENINGVEKITDTTFTTSDPSAIKLGDDTNIQTINIIGDDKDDKMKKVIIINDDVIGGENANVQIIHKGEGKEMDAEIEKALKEAGVDPNTKGVHKMVIVNEDTAPGKDGKDEKRTTKVVMIKMDITDASPEDQKRLNNQIGNADNKLEMDNMKMYPNPNNGKFNLNFNLKNKADAEVTVYNMEGKQVYNEKLPSFSGDYNKAIDISSNSKGIYFVKIQQGKHSQVKKIVMD